MCLFQFRFTVDISRRENGIIDGKMLRNYHSYVLSSNANVLGNAGKIDRLKIYQSILSKQLPPERYNGIVNLFYGIEYPDATTEEIESVLVICGSGN